MCSSTTLRRHAPLQLAILHSFARISLQAALHEPSFRDFRLTFRGLAATTSLLSTIHVADSCSRVRMWRCRLVQVHGRHFSIRTVIQAFHIPHSTYLLFSAAYSDVQEDQTAAPTFKIRKEFYVGCTSCTCHRRQDARLRKYKQLQLFQPISCELALHRFHNHSNIHAYIMVPLISCHSELQVKTTEASLIQKWTPMLNFPFIVRLMPTKKVTSTKRFVHLLSTKFGVPGNRLFRTLRRRLFHTMRIHLYHHSIFRNDHQWHILFQLAENSYQSFQTAKSLRCAQYFADQIFALYRLANNLEDPPRSKVRGLLKQAIRFKGAMLPCRAKALLIPVLAHNTFSTQVRSWLRHIVIERKDFLTPFHLPVCIIIPGKFPTMENKLYSHFGWMKKFSWDHPPQCPCKHLRELHPDLTTTSIAGIDHIASEARLLNVSRRLKFWLSCSAQTQAHPDFEEYCRISWHAVDQRLKHYKIGGIQYSSWREFISKQWIIHQRSAFVPVSMADIRFLRTLVADLVVQGRDHAAAHIHVYCPLLYHHLLQSTFGDPKVDTRRNMTPTAPQRRLSHIAASGWPRKYRWGIRHD